MEGKSPEQLGYVITWLKQFCKYGVIIKRPLNITWFVFKYLKLIFLKNHPPVKKEYSL